MVGLSHHELVVGNGASELINAVVCRYVNRLAVPVPTFDEFLNLAKFLGKKVCAFESSKRFDPISRNSSDTLGVQIQILHS